MKLFVRFSQVQKLLSPLAWGRGLKRLVNFGGCNACSVAPRVGAWIETQLWQRRKTAQMSPLAWGRGLKLPAIRGQSYNVVSPLAWGRGLKHGGVTIRAPFFRVAPRVGAWIETISSFPFAVEYHVAPRVGAWIETLLVYCLSYLITSPLAWGRGLKLLALRRSLRSLRRPSRGGVD